MKIPREATRDGISRRAFLLDTCMGAASVLALPRMAMAEPPPETTKLRIHEDDLLKKELKA